MSFKPENISEQDIKDKKRNAEFYKVSNVIEKNDSSDMLEDNIPEEKVEYVRQTFLITPDMKRAIKRKAANEDRGINEMVREILCNGIEEKYFEKY